MAAIRPAAPGDVVGGRRPGRRAGDPCPRDLTPPPPAAPRYLGGRRGRRGPRRRAPVGHAGPGPGSDRRGRAGDVRRPRSRVGSPGTRRPVGGPDRARPRRAPAGGGIAGRHRGAAPGAVPGAPRRGRRRHVPAEPDAGSAGPVRTAERGCPAHAAPLVPRPVVRERAGPGERRQAVDRPVPDRAASGGTPHDGTASGGTPHDGTAPRGTPHDGTPPAGTPHDGADPAERPRRNAPGRSGQSSRLRPVGYRPRRRPTRIPGPQTASRTGPGRPAPDRDRARRVRRPPIGTAPTRTAPSRPRRRSTTTRTTRTTTRTTTTRTTGRTTTGRTRTTTRTTDIPGCPAQSSPVRNCVAYGGTRPRRSGRAGPSCPPSPGGRGGGRRPPRGARAGTTRWSSTSAPGMIMPLEPLISSESRSTKASSPVVSRSAMSPVAYQARAGGTERVEQRVVAAGTDEQVGDLLLVHRPQHRLRAAVVVEHRAVTVQQRAQHAGHHADRMGRHRRGHDARVGARVLAHQRAERAAGARVEGVRGEEHGLRRPGRPGGEQHERDVVRADLRVSRGCVGGVREIVQIDQTGAVVVDGEDRADGPRPLLDLGRPQRGRQRHGHRTQPAEREEQGDGLARR